MKALAFILLIGVFVRHSAHNWLLSDGYSPAAIYYMLGGMWEATLCLVLAWVAYGYRYSIWRGILTAALFIGALEGFQTTGCRLAITDIKAVPRGANLCDYATGFPVGAVTTSVYLLGLCWMIVRAFRGRSA